LGLAWPSFDHLWQDLLVRTRPAVWRQLLTAGHRFLVAVVVVVVAADALAAVTLSLDALSPVAVVVAAAAAGNGNCDGNGNDDVNDAGTAELHC